MSCFTFFRFFFIQFSRYTPAVGVSRCLYGSLAHFFVWFSARFRTAPCGGHFALFVPRFLPLQVFFWLLAGLPPVQPVVGSNGLEPSTSRLSGVRSNHLSYEPMFVAVPVAILRPTFVCLRLSLYSFRDLKPYGLFCLKRVVRGAAVVEMNRIELSTPCLQGRCSPS